MNNLINLKKDIRTFLLVIWSFLLPSFVTLLIVDNFFVDLHSLSIIDFKFIFCCVLLLPPFLLYSIFLIGDLCRINRDIKNKEVVLKTLTIDKVSGKHTFLMCGAAKVKADYKTETYICIWGYNTDGTKVKIRVFPNVFDSKANICGRKYEVEYYQNSKIATKMTRIKRRGDGTVSRSENHD